MKIGTVSLGCDKNRIDTENMLAFLQEDGYELTQDPEQADIIIVNTCAFIESAKTESIDTIFEMAQYKKTGKCKYLVVTGCLSQRYMKDLYDEMPEVDLFVGTASYSKLPQYIKDMVDSGKRNYYENDINERYFSRKRVLTTPQHFAYVKIAEGCNNKCTYCAIPAIRGKYTSRTIEDIVDEVNELVNKYGVQEIVLVAQDVSIFGQDNYGTKKIVDLLKELCKTNIAWIRLLYLYPENITDELLDFMASEDKICKYLDIPLQHISNKILKLMNRHLQKSDIEKLFERIEKYNCFTIRSTFIVGFPREEQEDFEELEEFIKSGKIDRCGFFAYSQEEGTAAARLSGQIDESVKLSRQAKLYKLQQKVMTTRMARNIGRELEVIYEGIDYDKQVFVGRSKSDAPEIDTKVYFTSNIPVDIGSIYKVKIEKLDGLDYVGKVVEE